MPEKRLKELYNGISRQQRICFFAAVIFGFITHFYKITNWLPNWDSLVFRYDAQNMLPLGRWFLSFACAASSFYDLPWVNGVLSILFHSLGAVCICRIFDIKKGITAALIGAITVTIPTVASVMMYNYVADGYAAAFLLTRAVLPWHVLPAGQRSATWTVPETWWSVRGKICASAGWKARRCGILWTIAKSS